MSEIYPKYFYKYRSINNKEDLIKDHAIDALINNNFIFSSRRNFNDLFDSKVDLLKPSASELKRLIASNKLAKKDIGHCIKKGKITFGGQEFLETVEMAFNELIDSYGFLSLSSNPVSNLMWSHYADSHKGICIEYKSEFVQAEEVFYEDSIPQLSIYEMIRQKYFPEYRKDFGVYIWRALRTKLKEWEYESEYRYKANNLMGKIPKGQNYLKVKYEKKFVESVIFGCRTPESVKSFICENMGGNIKYKQVVVSKSSVEIKDF